MVINLLLFICFYCVFFTKEQKFCLEIIGCYTKTNYLCTMQVLRRTLYTRI